MSKYDWLLEDFRYRLPAEDKGDLVQAIRSFFDGKSAEARDAAVAVARRYGEGRIELFIEHIANIDAYTRGDSCEGLLERTLYLVARTSELGFDFREERLCHYERVIALLDMIDLPGNASQIGAMVDDADGWIPEDESCRGCVIPSRGRVREVQGDLDGAEAAYTSELARPQERHHIAYRLADLCELATQRGRLAEASTLLARAEGENERLDEPKPELGHRLAHSRILLSVAHGDLERAAQDCDALLGRVEPWNLDGLDANLAVARALLAAGRCDEAIPRAERCAARADARGVRRRHAESRLLAAEALLSKGRRDEAGAHAAVLARVVPLLGTRDLDDRARAVGAELPQRATKAPPA